MLFMRNISAPESNIQHQEPNTQVFIEQKLCGSGTLYIAEGCLSWISTNGEGLSFEYPSICLHAISRDTTSFPHPCIYMQIGLKLETDEPTTIEDAEEEDEGTGPEEDVEPCTVMRIVPENVDNLQAMFQSLSDCQALHPDPDDSTEETEFFNSAGDAPNMTQQGLITLQRLSGMLQQGDPTEGDPDYVDENGDENGLVNHHEGDGDAYDEAMDDQQEQEMEEQ